MKHTALALCLSLTLTSLSAFATDSSAAPSLTTAQLQTIHWQPTTIGATQEIDLTSAGQPATFPDASGKELIPGPGWDQLEAFRTAWAGEPV